MDAFKDFFPPGFWKTVAMSGTVVFFAMGVDLLFGARGMAFLGRMVNKKFHVDQIVVQALDTIKKNSDKEFDTERSLMGGWGRLLVSGVLIVGSAMMLILLVPKLH